MAGEGGVEKEGWELGEREKGEGGEREEGEGGERVEGEGDGWVSMNKLHTYCCELCEIRD